MQRILDFSSEALITQVLAAVDELLVQPGGADHESLPRYGQVGFQLHRHTATQALRVVLASAFGQVGWHLPDAVGQPRDDAGPAQRFQSPDMGFDQLLGIAVAV
ncbi:hypothetical protein D3C78_1201620 [compost metagenome]